MSASLHPGMYEISELEGLPPEIIVTILRKMDRESLHRTCQASSKLREICIYHKLLGQNVKDVLRYPRVVTKRDIRLVPRGKMWGSFMKFIKDGPVKRFERIAGKKVVDFGEIPLPWSNVKVSSSWEGKGATFFAHIENVKRRVKGLEYDYERFPFIEKGLGEITMKLLRVKTPKNLYFDVVVKGIAPLWVLEHHFIYSGKKKLIASISKPRLLSFAEIDSWLRVLDRLTLVSIPFMIGTVGYVDRKWRSKVTKT